MIRELLFSEEIFHSFKLLLITNLHAETICDAHSQNWQEKMLSIFLSSPQLSPDVSDTTIIISPPPKKIWGFGKFYKLYQQLPPSTQIWDFGISPVLDSGIKVREHISDPLTIPGPPENMEL